MSWTLEYLPEAEKDLKALDGSQRLLVLKAIKKVQQNPLPAEEKGYGKALGNHSRTNLAGFLKIKLSDILFIFAANRKEYAITNHTYHRSILRVRKDYLTNVV